MKHSKHQTSNVHSYSYRRFSWSNLPGRIIFKISKKLETRDDILRFHQVCSKWRKRSLKPPTTLLSCNIPLPRTIKDDSKAFPFHNIDNKSLVLRVSNIYLITPSRDYIDDQSFHPWMIMAEELNPGKLKVRHPLTAKRVKDFPTFLDMTRFKAVKLAHGYNFKSSNCVHKVLLCSNSNSASSVEALVLYYKGVLGKLSVEVVGEKPVENDDDEDEDEDELLYSWEKFRLRKGGANWFMYFDDVVIFESRICGVDRKGRLHILNTDSMSMSNSVTLASKSIYRSVSYNRRKRLVVDPTTGKLYLVVRERLQVAGKVRFKLYKLDEEGKRWDAVVNIGREKVLFVGIDHCFFAMARHFPGCDGNCIIFAANCFTQYNGCNAPDSSLFEDEGDEVGVYRLGEGDNFQLLSSACPEFAGIIWPPPTWFCNRNQESTEEGDAKQESSGVGGSSVECLPDDHAEGLLSESTSGENECSSNGNEEDVVMLSDSSVKDEDMDSDCSDDIDCNDTDASFSDQIDVQEQTAEEQSKVQEQTATKHFDAQKKTAEEHSHASKQTAEEQHSDAQVQSMDEHYGLHSLGFEEETITRVTRNEQPHEHGNCSNTDFEEERIFDVNHTPVTLPFSSAHEKYSTVKFQGVDIRPELLPTLQTTWAKHGNLFTKNTIHSKKMLGCAMEELAELVITLKNTTARTLTDSQADEMMSTLSDIQRAGLKVDWLEAAIKKAIAVQKSKPFIESIAAVDKKKAKIEEDEKAFLAKTAKIKKELEEDRACLSTRIPFPVDEVIDLDDILGDGI